MTFAKFGEGFEGLNRAKAIDPKNGNVLLEIRQLGELEIYIGELEIRKVLLEIR